MKMFLGLPLLRPTDNLVNWFCSWHSRTLNFNETDMKQKEACLFNSTGICKVIQEG